MHPIWFVEWAWEKAWSADGLLPLFEHNQGTLSLAALAFALWAFMQETKRANDAKAEAENAREAQRQAEEAQRIAAIREAREADEARRLNHLLDFVTTVNGIVAEAQRAMVVDRLSLAGPDGPTLLFPSGDLKQAARAAAGAIDAILPSAPPHPKAVMDARKASEVLSALASGPTPRARDGIAVVDKADETLTTLTAKMSDHHRALMAQLRPLQAEAFAAQSGAIEEPDTRHL